MATVTRRRALAALAPLLGAGAASRLLSGEAAAQHPQVADGQDPAGHANGHGTLEHAGFRRGGRVDHARNGFDPHAILRDFDGARRRARERPRAARVDARRARQGDRGRARRARSPPGPTTAASPGPTLRAREGERLRIRFVNGSAHPHTIHFHGIHPAAMDGVPGPRRRADRSPAARTVYEFDAEPFGLHLYHCHVRAAGRAHRQGPLRRLHHRPQGGARRRRRARDGDERVRHELRPRERGLRGQHASAFAYMDEPIAVRARRARADLPRQRPRVRPRSTRSTCTATSSTTSRPARRCEPARAAPTR